MPPFATEWSNVFSVWRIFHRIARKLYHVWWQGVLLYNPSRQGPSCRDGAICRSVKLRVTKTFQFARALFYWKSFFCAPFSRVGCKSLHLLQGEEVDIFGNELAKPCLGGVFFRYILLTPTLIRLQLGSFHSGIAKSIAWLRFLFPLFAMYAIANCAAAVERFRVGAIDW